MVRQAEVETRDHLNIKITAEKIAVKPVRQDCFSSAFVRSRVPMLRIGHGAVALGMLLASAPSAFAIDALAPLPNQNAAQKDMARSVDNVCETLDRRALAQVPGRTPGETELQVTCSRLSSTALEASGAGPLSGVPTYGLTVEETNNALQSINGEEMQAAQQRVGNIQASNIMYRLAAVRAGIAGRGFSTAGLRLGSGTSSAGFHDYGSDDASAGPLLASAGSAAPLVVAQADETEPWFGPWGRGNA